MNVIILAIVLIQIGLSFQYGSQTGLLNDAIQVLEETSGNNDHTKDDGLAVSGNRFPPSHFEIDKPNRIRMTRRKRRYRSSKFSSTATPARSQHFELERTTAPGPDIVISHESGLLSLNDLRLMMNGDARKVRVKRQNNPAFAFDINNQWTAQYRREVLPWAHWVTPNLKPSTPRAMYGQCSTHNNHLGTYQDSECLPGEICVDRDTLERVIPAAACPAITAQSTTQNNVCLCAANAPVPDTCPAGCPTKDCQVQMDGICIDIMKSTEQFLEGQYDHTDVPTPMVDYSGTLTYKQECTAYGDAINSVQKGSTSIESKEKNLDTSQSTNKFGSEICNWPKAHLECIPKEHRMTTTTVANQPPTQSQIDDYERPKGTCQCMLALGSRPAVVKEEIGDHEVDVCYIPANMGLASECDHEILPPHGVIEGVTDDGGYLYKGNQPAAKFCVPDSECRIGYKYTGLRCMCKPKTIWDPKTGTCSKSWRICTDNVTPVWAILQLIFSYFYF